MTKGHPYACYISNVLTILMSIALLIAASVLTSQTIPTRSVWTEVYSLSVYSIVISILALIFSIALIYVVYRKLPALTSLFTCFLGLVVILNIVCIIVLAVGLADLGHTTTSDMNKMTSVLRNGTQSKPLKDTQNFIDDLQIRFKCCGFFAPEDWKDIIPGGKSTPDSCCHEVKLDCGHDALITQSKIYDRPCGPFIYGFLRQKYVTLLIMNCILFVFLAAATALGYLAERTIRQQYESM